VPEVGLSDRLDSVVNCAPSDVERLVASVGRLEAMMYTSEKIETNREETLFEMATNQE
jgi:hypothetical protein